MLVLEIKTLFFTCCFTGCMAVHCREALFLRLHLFIQITFGNCSSEGAPHHLVRDPSVYLFLHITKGLLLPSLDNNNFKLLGQAIRLKTVRTVHQGGHRDEITNGLQSIHFSHFCFCFCGVIQSCLVFQCFNDLYNKYSWNPNTRFSEFCHSVTKALAALLNIYIYIILSQWV